MSKLTSFPEKCYVLKLYFYNEEFGWWCRNGSRKQDIWWIFLWGAENTQTGGFLSPILFNSVRKHALLPWAFAQLLLWHPKEKSSLSKTKHLFTESSEADSSVLHIEQDACTLFWIISISSTEGLLELKQSHVCSRRQETNTNRLSNLRSPHLPCCPRVPCSASSKFWLRARNKSEVEASESSDSDVHSLCDKGRRQLPTYQSHFFEGSYPTGLSTPGLNTQDMSDGNYYQPKLLATLIFYLSNN